MSMFYKELSISFLHGHCFPVPHEHENGHTLGRSITDPFPTHSGNFRRPGRGEWNHLKNVLNLYRMFGEGEGGIVNFLCGGR